MDNNNSIKYTYIYEINDKDFLNPNVYETSDDEAYHINVVTSPENQANTMGCELLITNPQLLKQHLASIKTEIILNQKLYHIEKIFIGYYYNPHLDSYVLDETAVTTTAQKAYVKLAQTLQTKKLLDNEEFNDNIDNIADLVELHEGELIEVPYETLNQFKARINEKPINN